MNEVYSAIYTRLASAVTLYDHVPQDLSEGDYPFFRLDPLTTGNNDVDDKSGFTATMQIVGFSRYRGSKEISNLAEIVYNTLHRHSFPDTANYGISGIQETFRQIAVQADGLTRNSVQRYEVLFEKLI